MRENNETNCVSPVALCAASSERFGVQCTTSGRVHKLLVRRLSRVRSPKWLETLRPVTGAESQVIVLHVLVTVLCGACLVRVDGEVVAVRGVEFSLRDDFFSMLLLAPCTGIALRSPASDIIAF